MHYYNVAVLRSATQLFTYTYNEKLAYGTLVTLLVKAREADAVIVEEVEKPSFECSSFIAIKPTYFSKQTQTLAFFISNYYVATLGETYALFTPFEQDKEVRVVHSVHTSIVLNDQQTKAYNFVLDHDVSLVFGDTGSGKTEVYSKLIEKTLDDHKRSLLLLPEISLTPQMIKRMQHHFGDHVVMWHSKQTKKRKEKALEAIRSGQANVIIGARSALFLPITNLGLIIVDEEHDDSYKSASSPRYHARDVAIYMGKQQNIRVVLGSATPTLSSFYKYPFVRLKGGYFNQQRTITYEATLEKISPFIYDKFVQTKANNEQSILFLPTRGNYKYVTCEQCGHSFTCPHCSVGLTLHQKQRKLLCHYCGFSIAQPHECSVCKGKKLSSSRMGTAQIVEELRQANTMLQVEQFDRDSVSTQTKLEKLLKRFDQGEIDLLVGTQMLSKGHDYHGVTFGAVLGIDRLLQIPDYRSREKALALLIQTIGRTGRKKEAQVVVQTFHAPFFSSYLHDYDAFLNAELERREGLYPPFAKLARILFAHIKEEKAKEAMQEMVGKLEYFPMVEVIGAGAAPIEKMANKYRFTILLRAKTSTDLLRAIYATKSKLAQVDIDPVEFS
jgi:primosomal protein N' (replication factor Y)